MAQPPNILQGPEPVETSELHFKLYSKLKVFESTTKFDKGKYSLVTVSQYYGLIIVGTSTGFTVIQTNSIKDAANSNAFPRKDITLSFRPTHISVDFTQKNLAVICSSQPGAILYIYSIASFTSKEITPGKVLHLSKLVQNLSAEVSELSWQPNTDGILMVCMSNGSVLSINPNGKEGSVHTLPSSTQAMCFCWSPKGKQIVIGCDNGCLSQYKPDLKLVKTLPSPLLFNGAVTVISVFWISNYQFAVSYNERNNPSSFPIFAIVNAAKNEPVNVINYDDITYSSTHLRQHQIYISHQSEWNLIFISSANSMEVAAMHYKDNSTWEQWLLGDASRAELPLNASRQETFPLGMAFDLTSAESIPWGETSLPPMPRLLLLSDEGVLCVFNIVNLTANAPQLCTPPKEHLPDALFATTLMSAVPTSGISQLPTSPSGVALPTADQTVQGSKLVPSQPTFGMPKPNFTGGFNLPGSGGFSIQPQNTTPQVTVSVLGGNIIGGIKDIPLLQPQQTNGLQFQVTQQQPVSSSFSTNFSLSSSSNLTQKLTTSAPQFGSPNVSTFTFGTPSSNSTFVGAKPANSQSGTDIGLSFSTPSPTPVTNQNNIVKEKPSMQQGNIFANKTNLPQSTPIKAVENSQKPASKSPATKSDIKAEENSTKAKGPSDSPTPALPELPAVDDSIYLSALHDEIDHFNSELRILSQKMKGLDLQVGMNEDKEKLRKTMEELHEFWKELNETTVSQSAEIHSVVTDLMESFAWLEDAKSRNLQRKNPSFIELKKTEELDPISERHMDEIGHLKYYIENQLKQLTSHLEKEWMDHQDSYRMEVKNQMAVPPLEEVYKTMHYQLKILNKQRALVEELKSKIRAKKRQTKSLNTLITNSTPIVQNLQGSSRVSELSKLADNLLQLKINREENVSAMENWKAMKYQLNTIRERSNKLTLEKQAALRDLLSERDMVKIRPIKTSIESSSFLRSLALEKSAQKAAAKENEAKAREKENKKPPSSPVKLKNATLKPKAESKPKSKDEKSEMQEKVQPQKQEQTPKSMFVFGSTTMGEKPLVTDKIPTTSVGDKSPLASLSSVVSNLGKESDTKSTGVFGNLAFVPPQTSKESFAFCSADNMPSKKPEDNNTLSKFTFGSSKPSEITFGKAEPKFDGKLAFGSVAPTFSAPKQEPVKTVSNATASLTRATTTTTSSSLSSFTFSTTPVTDSGSLPKMNLVFGAKDQNWVFTTTSTPSTGSLFSVSSTSASGFSFGSGSIFGAKTTANSVASTSVVSTSSSGFTFAQPAPEQKNVTETSVITSNTEPKNTEINVGVVDESNKKVEPPVVTKPSTNFVFGIKPQIKVSAETMPATVSSSTSSVQTSPPAQTAITTTSTLFGKPLVSTSANTSTPSLSIFGQATTSTPTSSLFSFSSTGSSTLVFGQTSSATTTTATTTTAITTTTTTTTPLTTTIAPVTTTVGTINTTVSNQATTTVNAVSTITTTTTTPSLPSTSAPAVSQQISTTTSTSEKPSSTTPLGIFGGTMTTNIFGGSSTSASKPIFAQAAPPTTSATGNIFGGGSLTPTTNTFGQPSSPTSTASAFNDSVSQTTNIFGQLLSESNQSSNLFVTSSATSTTTPNLFSTPKNIFSNATTTSSSSSIFGGANTSLFGSSGSVFGGQSTGQSAVSSSIFGQTPTSNSFFGQNICSPFSASTSVTSNQSSLESGGFGSKPVFGQRPFGQMTANTSLFGGSSNTSIFGGSSNSASSGGNVFQTTTTSFGGSVTPGPFSSSQGSVGETGFKAASTFQKPLVGGFGSPPVFGGGPSTSGFGMAPTFSGGPTFGSQATFGSVSGVFNSSQGTFGQSQGHSTTFENLANQNTVGFGNLAQQSQSQGFGAFNSAPAFENKPAFGGSSFSSWRSN